MANTARWFGRAMPTAMNTSAENAKARQTIFNEKAREGAERKQKRTKWKEMCKDVLKSSL